MLSFLKNMFGSNSTNYKLLVSNGAVIIDVRTPGEYSSGNIRGSKNIPLNVLKSKIPELKKTGKPVIAVCASGARSGMARTMLEQQGIEAYNGGSWLSLVNKL
ncbi:MAG TPA: rhodanese-like domain-containing protein [Chitinophagaceae bacterium]|jgi:rhodanese-related sulfurtransferase|nr:rhodanese-like domain-containing protein [Chitinophagaceae bacterium]